MKTPSLLTLTFASACALALGCGKRSSSTETKSGPAVAHVGNDVITADEFKKKLDETSPFLRARYNTLDRKKEFLENLVRNELLVQEAEKREVSASELGERVMTHLRELDEVAYVRFASVYRSFRDVDEFLRELGKLVQARGGGA